jgi:ComF family protein
MGLGDALASAMSASIRSLDWQIEIVAPVPLSRKRLAERGYNQVSMVALPLTLMCGWGYRPQALSRARETRSQVGLSREERRQNVRDAFAAQPSIVRGKTILVIDDVTTTGATLEACAAALLKAGARQVYGYTVARALARHGLKDV